MTTKVKYSDLVAQWLQDLGYTHCFYVAGGNIMHLLASCAKKFEMTSVIHEAAAGIACEYFNVTSPKGKAFVLVTAGPGMTNIITAMAGAFLESRELLVLGGQVKTADLSRGKLRQRGIQEIDGVSIAKPLCASSTLVDGPLPPEVFMALASSGSTGRKAPVFIEIPLDVQGAQCSFSTPAPAAPTTPVAPSFDPTLIQKIAELAQSSDRPGILLGGGVSKSSAAAFLEASKSLDIPIFTTWNGADLIGSDHPLYFGRPNTWGMRYSNILLQQCDFLLAIGTRLGMQQTGFNWQQFAPLAKVVQVDIDAAELEKGHPRVDIPVLADAASFLSELSIHELGQHKQWVDFCKNAKTMLPLQEPNQTAEGYISPHAFVKELSALCQSSDIVIPCSSGSAFTTMMQGFMQKTGQTIVTNKGLASMGYGLSGAIGASLANPGRRTILVEGDGGFAQNMQEIGTAAVNKLPLKIFIYDDHGYASIRMTQRNYFGGKYIGCDIESGLGLPVWTKLFDAFGVDCMTLPAHFESDPKFQELFSSDKPAAFIVPIDPEQTYFPKITSRITSTGTMESSPLHMMTPDLPVELAAVVLSYLSLR